MNNMSRTTPLFEAPFQAPPPLRRERPEDYGIYDGAFVRNVEDWFTSLPLEDKLHYMSVFSRQTEESMSQYRESMNQMRESMITSRTPFQQTRLGAQHPNEQIHPLERDISSRGPQQLSPLMRQTSMPEYDFGESTIFPEAQSSSFMSRSNVDIIPMEVDEVNRGPMTMAELDGPMTLEELELPNDNDDL